MMAGRLILAIFSTLVEEAAVVAIVLWGLPQLGIYISRAGLIAIMVAWAGFSVAIYRMGSRALKRKPVTGLPEMIGSKAKAVNPLAPNGTVKIKNELWDAVSVGETVDTGEEVTVVGQDSLKLIVRKSGHDDSLETE